MLASFVLLLLHLKLYVIRRRFFLCDWFVAVCQPIIEPGTERHGSKLVGGGGRTQRKIPSRMKGHLSATSRTWTQSIITVSSGNYLKFYVIVPCGYYLLLSGAKPNSTNSYTNIDVIICYVFTWVFYIN